MIRAVICVALAACGGARSQYVYEPQPTAACGVLRPYQLPVAATQPPARMAKAVKAERTARPRIACK